MIAGYAALLVLVLAALAYACTHGETRAFRALGGRSFRIDACQDRTREIRLNIGLEAKLDFARVRGTWVALNVAGLGVRVACWKPA